MFHPEFNQFMLFDLESGRSLSALASAELGAIASSGAGGALFFTHHDISEAAVELEVWDGEAAAPAEVFEDSFEGDFTISTGRAVLGAVTASPNDRVVELPANDRYRLRAFRTRSSVPPEDPDDVEISEQRWLLQVWPANRRYASTRSATGATRTASATVLRLTC
ncbi:hypothetical protein [Amycolatopsis sacchari]|uniref:hypothetical protein n=1 Tax=Amycolatopsis sacchari TaxID=115433 RepID=UPI003D71C9BA